MSEWMAKHRLAQAVGDIAYSMETDKAKAAARYLNAYNGMMKSLEWILDDANDHMNADEWLLEHQWNNE